MATDGMRILVAVDGSPCSMRTLEQMVRRPWPAGSEVELVTVAHTRIPLIPEPTLTGYSLHEYALDEQRARAKDIQREAQQHLAAIPEATIHCTILDGDPGKTIVEEAIRWNAELVVVGSHSYGVVIRALLGSVSQHVALHAPCSVEIVRCPSASTD